MIVKMKFIELKEIGDRKRFRFTYENNGKVKNVKFGQIGGETYIDHGDKQKRENYIKRHSVRENWNEINPGSLSRFILWGDSPNIDVNLKRYLKRFKLRNGEQT